MGRVLGTFGFNLLVENYKNFFRSTQQYEQIIFNDKFRFEFIADRQYCDTKWNVFDVGG